MKSLDINIDFLAKAQKGDRKAQNALYKYCFSKLMPICYRYTHNEELAREELNQSFVKIIHGLKKYNSESPFDAWIKRITINSIIDNHRKNKKHKYHDDINEVTTEYKMQHENPIEDKFSYEGILNLLLKVPETSRKVFKLYVIEGYNHKEIGEMLDMSDGTSKWHLNNARKILKSLIHKSHAMLLGLILWII